MVDVNVIYLQNLTPESPTEGAGTLPSTTLSWVHGPYFQTLGIALKRGRFFFDEEYTEDRHVIIVNEKLAKRFWPGLDPIGKRLKYGPSSSSNPWLTIVGVVGDVADGPLGGEPAIHAYEPFRQIPDPILDRIPTGFGRDVKLAILAQGDPMSLVDPVRREIKSVDSQLAIASIALMDRRMAETVAPQRYSMLLLTGFACAALVLVAIGLYGLLAFTVAQRAREIGVRMALGADRHSIVRMIFRRGLRLVVTGLALGLIASVGAVRLLSSLLYKTGSYDAVTFAVVPLVLCSVTLLACGIPAHRAARVEPVTVLRHE